MAPEAFRRSQEARAKREGGSGKSPKLLALLKALKACDSQWTLMDSEDVIVPGDLWREILSLVEEVGK